MPKFNSFLQQVNMQPNNFCDNNPTAVMMSNTRLTDERKQILIFLFFSLETLVVENL